MLLENIGKIFFLKMRPLFFFILILLPLLGSILFLISESAKSQDLEDRFLSAARKSKTFSQRKARKEQFLIRYSNPDPYFLDREIESLPLLKNEKTQLFSLLQHPAFSESPLIQDRIEQLKKNALAFTEGKIYSSSFMKETEERLRYPVQMDEGDLKKLLAIIEDLSEEKTPRPQLLIKNFSLKKTLSSLQTEVFEVDLDLLKREFTQ